MLTQNDVQEIKRVIQEEVGDKINLLPTKEEFFSRMDKLSGEIQKVQVEKKLSLPPLAD